ncbi:peptidase M24 [Neolentinus lepideus HHB14362 ss-1]|uniref:Peptidase M24 n=1 Tax=Neolentinus lepideus HHB14362 ss-1 TaxID=1314782 RepID=A0A165P7R7_9AGAM|nr:peptidase M24 [Neolentinus lepideus HHB14362 ss-1]
MSVPALLTACSRPLQRARLSSPPHALRRRYATEVDFGLHPPKPSEYGQPLFESHPHLVKADELTPGIPSHEYERRRKELMDSLPEHSIVISIAAPVKYMSGQIFYKFRQASDFWYLSGFEEPDSASELQPYIIEKNSTSKGYRMTLFASGKDFAKEKWEGARTSLQAAATHFRADDALHITSFASTLKSLIPMYSNVYVDLPPSTTPSRRRSSSSLTASRSLLKYLTPSFGPKGEFEAIVEGISGSKRRPLAQEVAKLRSIKSVWEQGVMREAADISARAHAKTMRFARPDMPELSLAAHFEYLCALSGAQRPAYVPVVASGANGLIIHYTTNDHIVRDGEMVLVDAGCEYNGYASDITRTFPASGSFTSAQRDLYQALLNVQKALIQACSLSSSSTNPPSLNSLHVQSCVLLREELNQLGFGLQRGDLERELYPHYLSHPIGIDLHESTYNDRDGTLRPGMVITIEPGVYVPPSPVFPKHFHNMGIRIEDEVLVGEGEPTILSVSAPKEIVDIEGACQGVLGLEPY